EPQDWLLVSAQARVGQVLNGKWRLDQLLGIGGMAAVFAATHRNGNRVAVKMLHPHCVANDAIRSRFQREGYVANMIDHVGAVRVLDDDRSEDGGVFLVMELLEGETLEERIKRRGRLPAEEALGIVYHLLETLAVAHGKGVVHRDIKLDNVFITRAGEVKVLDFGIARLAEASWQNSADRTRTNATMGTPAFMAPEQALGRSSEVDAKTDLWAVGATLFKLLTARNVHEATTINEQLVNAATKPAPPLRSVLPGAAPALAGVVDRALAFAKADRWPEARAMQEAMRPLLSRERTDGLPWVRPSSIMGVGEAAPPSGTVEEGPVPAPRRQPALAVVLVAAAVVLVGAWLLLRPRPTAPVVVRPSVTAAPPPVVVPSPPPPPVEKAAVVEPEAPPVKEPAVRPAPRAHEKRRKAARPAEPGGDDIWDRRH
ncbi:MAG TPA: protein kinase, partial [Polyangia bacterium]|nr:protein kinase [Polyangia bacterium]